VNTVMNLRVAYKAGNFLTSLATISFSRRPQLHGISALEVINNAIFIHIILVDIGLQNCK
jgi:hypothetical protein